MTDQLESSRPNPGTEPSLTARVVKGSAWVFVGKVGSRGLQAIKLVVLARLLVPEDFGLFGIVMLALSAAETFTQTGFQTALVQKQGNTEDYLDTAWTVQVLRGFVLAGTLFAISPLLAWFFDEPRVVPLLRALSAMEALRGFTNIGVVYFQKELEFHKQVTYQLFSSAVALAVGVVLAWQLRNVWALVWGSLAGQVTSTALSYVLHPYRARVRLDRQQVTELFGFGRWLLGNSIVSFLATQADRVILGRLLGAAALGIYNMADRIGGLLPTEFMHLTNEVMMPAYAKVQDDKERLGRAFIQVFGTAVSVGGPVAAFVFLAAPELVPVILGAEWLLAIVPLQILAVGGFLRCVIGVSSPVFLATGHPNIQFWKSLIRAVVTVAAIFPLTARYGIPGTALAGVLGVVALSPLFLLAVKIVKVGVAQLVEGALPGLLLTAAAALGVIPGKFVSGGPLYAFSVQIVGSSLLTFATFLVLGRHDLGPSVMVNRYLRSLRPESEILSAGET
ncbi:MAG: lipopolysaccharide biosynthesis protein [Chloroflexota bacterium]